MRAVGLVDAPAEAAAFCLLHPSPSPLDRDPFIYAPALDFDFRCPGVQFRCLAARGLRTDETSPDRRIRRFIEPAVVVLVLSVWGLDHVAAMGQTARASACTRW